MKKILLPFVIILTMLFSIGMTNAQMITEQTGFEGSTSLTGWSFNGGGSSITGSIELLNIRTGTQSLKLNNTSNSTRYFFKSSYSALSGESYHAIGWAKSLTGTQQVSVYPRGGSGSPSSGDYITINNTNWTRFSKTYSYTGNENRTVRWYAIFTGTPTDIFFDDLIVYKNNSATIDLTSPNAPTSLSGNLVGSNAILQWSDGLDVSGAGTTGTQGSIVLKYTGSASPAPTAPTLNNQGAYINATVIGNWVVVNDNAPTASTGFNAGAITANTTYAVYHRDLAYNWSLPTAVTINVCTQPTITLTSIPSVLQGTTSSTLSYTATTQSPDEYSITWSPTAVAQGFTNVTNNVLPASPISIIIPAAGNIGTYTANLVVKNSSTNCSSLPYTISVEITGTVATLTTTNAINITNNSAESGGNITDAGTAAINTRGLVWSLNPNPTIALTTKTINGKGTGTFTGNITGLGANNYYYYRAYATSDHGTGYGNEFVLLTLPPTPNINSASLITANSFQANFAPASNPGNGSYTFELEYSTDPGFTTVINTISGIPSTSTNNSIGSLSLNTTYYYRVRTNNASGYSPWTSFSQLTTLASTGPVINMTPSSLAFGNVNIGSSSGEHNFEISGAYLNSSGNGNITLTTPAGFEISTSTGTGFTTNLNLPFTGGTLPNTTVYIRFSPVTVGTHTGDVTGSWTTVSDIITVSGTGVLPPAVAFLETNFDKSSTGVLTGIQSVTNADYVNLTTPGTDKFNSINLGGHSSITGELNGDNLNIDGTANNGTRWSVVRSTNFPGTPTNLQISFNAKIDVTNSSSSNPGKWAFQIGQNFTNDITLETANMYAGFRLKYQNSSYSFLTDWNNNGNTTTDFQINESFNRFLVVVNKNSNANNSKYLAPDGSEQTLLANTYDVWVGNKKMLSAVAATNTGLNLLNLKFGDLASANGRGLWTIDNFLVAPISPTPIATTAASITNNSFIANWNMVTGINGFYLDVSTSPTFDAGTFVAGYENRDVGPVNTYPVNGILDDQNYYYRVRAYTNYNVDKYTSGHSNTITATTLILNPDIVLNTTNPAIPAALVGQGSNKNPVYKFTIASTNNANIRLTSIAFTSTGSYTSTDVVAFKLWYNTSDNLNTATQIGTDITATGPGTKVFNGFTHIIQRTTVPGYFWITADVNSISVGGHTIQVNALTNSDFTFITSNSVATNAYTGGVQTISISTYYYISGNPSISTNWNANPDGSGSSATGFNGNGLTYIFTTATTNIINNNLTISGSGSKILLQSNANVTIATSSTVVSAFELQNNSVLNIQSPNTAGISFTGLACGTTNGSWVNYSGTGVKAIPYNYCNLGIDNGANLTADNIIGVAQVFNPGTVTTADANSHIVFNGTDAQLLPVDFIYRRLTINNTSATSTITTGPSGRKVYIFDSLNVKSNLNIISDHWLTMLPDSYWEIAAGKSLTIGQYATLDQQTKFSPAIGITDRASLPAARTRFVVEGIYMLNSNQLGTNYGGPSANATRDANNNNGLDGIVGTFTSTSEIRIEQGVPRIPESTDGSIVWFRPFGSGEETFLYRQGGNHHNIGKNLTIQGGKINVGSGGVSRTLTVGGNLYVEAGEFHAYGGGESNQKLIINGDTYITGGSLYAGDYSITSGNGYQNPPEKIIEFRGNIFHTAGALGNGIDTTFTGDDAGYSKYLGGLFIFNGTNEQTIQTTGFDKSLRTDLHNYERYIKVQVNNAGNIRITGNSIFDPNDLEMVNGKIIVENGNLVFPDELINTNENRYIVTLGSGALKLKRIGVGGSPRTANQLFDVGVSVNYYTPVRISNNGVTDNYAVTVRNIENDGFLPASVPFQENFVTRVLYDIHEEVPGGSDVTLDLQWVAGENHLEQPGFEWYRTSFATPAYAIGHFENGMWMETPCNISPVASTVYFKASAPSFTSFSPFMVGIKCAFATIGCAVLPVDDIVLQGSISNNNSLLNWQTINETDIHIYKVEVSTDGVNFKQTGEVKSNGNGNFKYNYTDKNKTTGIYFYRITAVDKNGSSKYSNVITLSYSNQTNGYSLFPNPATNNINITHPLVNAQSELSVIAASGAVLHRQLLYQGTYNTKLNVGHLLPGIYFVKIVNNSMAATLKFVKK